jgi:hypothetical protein
MEDPVMSKEGQCFERKAILEWFDEGISNNKFQWEIRQWQLADGDTTQEMSRLETVMASLSLRDYNMSDMLRTLTTTTQAESGSEEKKDPTAVRVGNALDVLNKVCDAFLSG